MFVLTFNTLGGTVLSSSRSCISCFTSSIALLSTVLSITTHWIILGSNSIETKNNSKHFSEFMLTISDSCYFFLIYIPGQSLAREWSVL